MSLPYFISQTHLRRVYKIYLHHLLTMEQNSESKNMDTILRKTSWSRDIDDPELLILHEWIVTNGLGGYASGSISGVVTRRYHGFLISAIPENRSRIVMLNHIEEELVFVDGSRLHLGCLERSPDEICIQGTRYLKEFYLENGLPVWLYETEKCTIEKRILMPHLQNTVVIFYRLLSGQNDIKLNIRPSIHFRYHGDRVDAPIENLYKLRVAGDCYEVNSSSIATSLRMKLSGAETEFVLKGAQIWDVFYRHEYDAGYDAFGKLWNPGFVTCKLTAEFPATLIASTESWNKIDETLNTDQFKSSEQRQKSLISKSISTAQKGIAAELVLAADQFIINPITRSIETAKVRLPTTEPLTIIAGYHWFTDWGRDTMISLEGLSLITGRYTDAYWILLTFSHHIKHGLVPNLFPEKQSNGLYNTADATLWYFNAIQRYIDVTSDRSILAMLLPQLADIIEWHIRGTDFGIGLDHSDHLLRQGAHGYQLTWMDAKVGDWVVTPRHGKAVEINGLWYNALRLMEEWTSAESSTFESHKYAELASLAYESFNKRFWNSEKQCLYDVIDGELEKDASCRPNQLLSFSLKYAILDNCKWEPVLSIVQKKLLTPVGLRSLSPDHKDYKSIYHGDLRSRDAAYHQGTIWAWLIGPFIDAWIRVYPEDRVGARRFIDGFNAHLGEACVGSISEIFDAEAPFIPRGCIAQAWSVAEVLRSWVKTSSELTNDEIKKFCNYADEV